MAISDYSTTAASNTSISGIDISGTTGKVKDGDNAIRQLMADIKAGVPYLSGTSYLAESTDAGATAGPIYDLYRNSASPAASDILGQVIFNGKDSAGNKQEYASIQTVIADATSTSEDGTLEIYTTVAGTRTRMAYFDTGFNVTTPTFISTASSGTAFTVTSTDAGSASGPNFDLLRDSASPAVSDNLASFEFRGRDSGGNLTSYARIASAILDPVDGSEDGLMNIGAAIGGTITTFIQLQPTAGSNQVRLPLGQLLFPSTQNPSSDANTMDDYEEGTFTPAVTFGGGSTGLTYSSRTGRYTKQGDRVDFHIRMVLSAKGSSTGTAAITGLPFTSGAEAAGGMFLSAGSFASLTAGMVWAVTSGSTDVNPRVNTTTGTAAATDANFTNTSQFYFTGTYFV